MAKQETNVAYRLNGSATHLLHRAQQAAVTLSVGALAEKGLTIRQFAVLAALYDASGQSQSSLVQATGIDRSTLADMVARMEKGGLIKRTISKLDARAKTVSLSAAGKRAYLGAVGQVEAADTLLLKGLRKAQRPLVVAALAALAGAIDDDQPSATGKKTKAEKKKKKKKKKKRAD